MHRILIATAFLFCASTLHAGVYNLDEVHPFVPVEEARAYLLRVRSAALPVKGALRPEMFKAQVLKQVELLEAKKRDGLFATLDRVALSACYMRLGGDRAADAIRLLSAGDRDHFLVQSNLAAAYFQSGELLMAVRHQERALAQWPAVFGRWTDAQLRQYRDCELTLLRLYRARSDETRRGPIRGEVDVDPIFPGLRYIGPSGEYEAGGLSVEYRDRLPANAFGTLYQIALWFPTDMRLYWQLGELLNAAGQIDQAHDIFIELVEAGMATNFKGLTRHRRVLIEAKPVYAAFNRADAKGMLLTQLLLVPRPLFAAPGLGDAAHLVGCLAPAVVARRASGPEIEITPPSTADGVGVKQPPVFNFTHVTAGFGFGFLVAALMGLQWQEWRRRRQTANQAVAHGVSSPDPPSG